MNTIKTTVHTYRFDISKPEDAEAYQELIGKLEAKGLKVFSCLTYSEERKPADGQTIELELDHLFNNQWNTAPFAEFDQGLRVFDWYEPIYPYKSIKDGYWLEPTPEMAEVRRNTLKCGYCGKQEPAAKGYVFCSRCLGNVYLKAEDLFLLRLVPIYKTSESHKPLTKAESDHLLPLYEDAQLKGNTERSHAAMKRQREDIQAKYLRQTKSAKTEHDGLIWLLDHDVKIDNVIYYSHTDVFCFGWITPVSEAVKAKLLDMITDFPFSYQIKCANGEKLEGVR